MAMIQNLELNSTRAWNVLTFDHATSPTLCSGLICLCSGPICLCSGLICLCCGPTCLCSGLTCLAFYRMV